MNSAMMGGPVEAMTPRAELLREAEKIVTKDRNSAYGNPEDNFRDIAELQSAYMRGKIGPVTKMDVVCLNILTKIARLKNNPGHRDSLVDIAGYAACGADIQQGMEKEQYAEKEAQAMRYSLQPPRQQA